MTNKKKKLVLGVIGADVHAVGNRILDFAFSQAGFEVDNLGVMVSQEEFIDAAIETNADAIIVSSCSSFSEWEAAWIFPALLLCPLPLAYFLSRILLTG